MRSRLNSLCVAARLSLFNLRRRVPATTPCHSNLFSILNKERARQRWRLEDTMQCAVQKLALELVAR